ncbi:MAG: nucleotide exchange factor GrpE [Chloroflexia bacterium]|nr:nucleotide exchange factor GrpE [Chloroflexia bacterium]
MSEEFVKANEEAKNTLDDVEIENPETGVETEIEEGVLVTLLERERERSEKLADDLLRSQAELQNYRRRMEQKQDEVRARAVETTLRKLLPVADDFHRALKTLPTEVDGNSWAQGFRLIESNLWKTFESEGVTAMNSVGKLFDPARHEAVVFDETTTGNHMVVEEFQRGYLIQDRVLRPAMVKVGSIASDGVDEEQHIDTDSNQ